MAVDILISNSYYLEQDATEKHVMRPYPPLGPLSVATYLRDRAGYEVAAFDTTFRTDPSVFAAALERLDPRVVGIHATIISRTTAAEMIRIAKAQGRIVIMGGPDPSECLQEYLLEYGADYVVIAEGEETARELMDHLTRGAPADVHQIAGIAYKRDGRVTRTLPRKVVADLDAIPRPDLDLINIDWYLKAWQKHRGETSLHIMMTRGCPYACKWCSKAVFGQTYRARAPEEVADEMKSLIDRYHPDWLWIADDLVGVNKKWVARWHAAVMERGAQIPFECLSRVDIVEPEMLRQLKEIGCRRIYFGVESGSQKVLDRMQKDFQVESIYRAAEMTKAAGIERGFFIMLGYLDEKHEDVRMTRRVLLDLQPEFAGFSVAYPLKGTPFFEEVKDQMPQHAHWTATNENRVLWNTEYSQEYYRYNIAYMQKILAWKRRKRTNVSALADLVKAGCYRTAARVALHSRRERPAPGGNQSPQLNVFSSGC